MNHKTITPAQALKTQIQYKLGLKHVFFPPVNLCTIS